MALEVTGRVVSVLPRQEGTSAKGNWVKQSFVLETASDRFPRKICFIAWNELADEVNHLQEGMLITVSFDLESREYNGRWYTDARAWRIVPNETGGVQPVQTNAAETAADDDLPF